MRIKTCHPPLLPIQNIQWEKIISLIGTARDLAARFDEDLKKTPHVLFLLEPLFWKEAISSIREHPFSTAFANTMKAKFSQFVSEKDANLSKIIATKDAFDIAIHWGKNRKIGPRFLCRIHQELRKDAINKKDIGKIRNRQNWIGAEGCKIEEAYFYPPATSRVRLLIHNLEHYFRSHDLDPLVQIAIGFAQLLIIHPFMDGNGRVGRVLIPFLSHQKKLLSQPALWMSEYFEENRLEYFQKLFAISENEAWEEWIYFFLKGAILQLERSRKRFHRLDLLWQKTVSNSDGKIARILFHHPLVHGKKREFHKLIQKKFLIAQGDEYDFSEALVYAMRI